jgi:hypothetical protein
MRDLISKAQMDKSLRIATPNHYHYAVRKCVDEHHIDAGYLKKLNMSRS